jgi:membrane protease YdiL (CAAX protease family)
MQLPSLVGIGFLVYLVVVLPVMAWRSAVAMKAARDDPEAHPLPPRTGIYAGTILMLVVLFVLSGLVGRTFGYDPFTLPPLGLRDALAGGAALGGAFGLYGISRLLRSEAERRRSPVLQLMPRTRTEWALYLTMCLAAGIAEETAYRGVGMAVLASSTGSAWVAGAVLSLAFGLAHITQEWKSVWIVVAMAVMMHALVACTGTLVVAMAVHAIYDILAGYFGSREAERLCASAERQETGQPAHHVE